MITKGIARLLEGMAKAKGATKAVSPATQLRNAQSAKLPSVLAQMNKKNYSDAFNKARARINDMNMSSAQKDDAVESLRTFYRNQHSEEMMRISNLRRTSLAGNFANFPMEAAKSLTPVPDLVKQGLAFALGGGAGYGVAKNEEAIVEMLKAAKLPTGIDIETTSIGDLIGGGTGKALSKINREDYILPYEGLFPEEEELEEPSLGTKTGNLLIDILSPIPRSWGE